VTPMQAFLLLMGIAFFLSLLGPSTVGGYSRFPEPLHGVHLFPLIAALLVGVLGVQVGEAVGSRPHPTRGRVQRALWGGALVCAALVMISPFFIAYQYWTGTWWGHLVATIGLVLTVGVLWAVIAMWVVDWVPAAPWRFEVKYLALGAGYFLPLIIAPAASPLLAITAVWEGRVLDILPSWAGYTALIVLSLGWWRWKDQRG